MVLSDTKSSLDEPQMFNHAWNHPNKDTQKIARSYLQGVFLYTQATGTAKDT